MRVFRAIEQHSSSFSRSRRATANGKEGRWRLSLSVSLSPFPSDCICDSLLSLFLRPVSSLTSKPWETTARVLLRSLTFDRDRAKRNRIREFCSDTSLYLIRLSSFIGKKTKTILHNLNIFVMCIFFPLFNLMCSLFSWKKKLFNAISHERATFAQHAFLWIETSRSTTTTSTAAAAAAVVVARYPRRRRRRPRRRDAHRFRGPRPFQRPRRPVMLLERLDTPSLLLLLLRSPTTPSRNVAKIERTRITVNGENYQKLR